MLPVVRDTAMPPWDPDGPWVMAIRGGVMPQDGLRLLCRSRDFSDDGKGHFCAIIEAFDGFIYVCSRDYRIAFMNRRLIQRTGYDGTGDFCYKVLHGRTDICPWCVNPRVFTGETVRWDVQSPRDRRWYHVVNTPVYGADGVVAKQAMIYDITHRKQNEAELRQVRAELEKRVADRTVALETLNRELAESSRRRQVLSERLIELLESERRMIARELHDQMGQAFSTLRIGFDTLAKGPRMDQADFERRVRRIENKIVRELMRVKNFSYMLRPHTLDNLGLVPAIRELVTEVESNTGLHIRFFTKSAPDRFNPEVDLALYRIVQEALNNVVKHAEASRVYINLIRGGSGIGLSIEDDGRGFVPEALLGDIEGRRMLGILIMQERAGLACGEFTIESRPGKGTQVFVNIPL